jgi:hypothetical protein
MAVRIKVRRETGGAGDTPTTSDLEAYEIAQNTADKRLFGRDGSNNIFEFGINPTSLTTGAITASGTVTANSSLVSSNATFTGGTINGMVIGGSSAAAITGTVVTASTNFAGNITGNVTGNVTGNITGNISGDVTGNVTAGSGTSTFNNLVVNGTVDFTDTVLTNLASPSSDTDAATKGYVDTQLTNLVGGAPAALDTLNELAAALNDDAAFNTTITNSIATKLPLAGGTMSGAIAMGSNKVTGLTDGSASGDAVNKGQLDTMLPLAGGTMSGNIVIGSNVITSSANPSDDTHLARKAYVDSILGSATSAATSASTATTKASEASTSATNAASSATAAASSATSAANSFDAFDDIFLGAKSSDPSVDNDGDALATGALYFNSSSNVMKVYGGSSWANVAPTATSITASQISDVTSTAAELNLNDGSSAGTIVNSKTVVYGSSGEVNATTLQVGGTAITSTPQELNILDALSRGSLIYGNSSGATAILTKGAADTVLTSDGTDISWVAPAPAGNIHSFTASGAVASGKPVILNANGTVTQVAAVSESLGSEAVFSSGVFTNSSSCYDSTNDKIVIVYADGGNSDYGTAVVGTVSGTTLSFGTPVVFEAAETINTSASFDSASGKVVITYRDAGNSNHGTAIVGTVSGTSISFGTAVVFESATTQYTSSTFDSNSNKIVIAYRDTGNSSYGTAIVGTVSGTSISFGTPVVFESAATVPNVTFDSSNNKVVIAYQDGGNSNYGTAIVGTVSGTGISFGSAAVFESAGIGAELQVVFDSTANKVVVAYMDTGNSSHGTAAVGTVSGTSISFGTPVVFEAASTDEVRAAYDSTSNTTVISYVDGGNSNYGTYVIGTVSDTSISFGSAAVFKDASVASLTSAFDPDQGVVVFGYRDGGSSNDGAAKAYRQAGSNANATNFVGIANAAISDGASGSVTVQGGLITNSNLATLTIGSTYYVQNDGTFATTTSNVIAGKALAATTLLLKGI